MSENRTVSIVFAAANQRQARELLQRLTNQTYKGKVQYCYSCKGTIPEAMNESLRKATGDFILFTETDVKHPPNWIEKMVELAEPRKLIKALEVNSINFNFASTICYKEDIEGMFLDETYRIAEDTDFFCRLKQKGILMENKEEIVVQHLRDNDSDKQVERALDYGYIHAKLIDKYEYYPLEKYKKRMQNKLEIAQRTLKGIEKYEKERKKR